MGPPHCRRRAPTVAACASSTPPTGTSGGPSTGRACSGTRRRTSTTCSRSSTRERVDLVVVAGDVYDRALPPVDAVRLADETLRPAGRVPRPGGGHQRQPRLRPAARLRLPADRRRRASTSAPTPHRRHARSLLDDEHGPVAVYGLPYLDPDALREPWALPGRSHEAALDRGDARGSAPTSAGRPGGTRSVVLAHAFVAGAEPSDSERDISVGGVSIVPTIGLRRRRLRRARPPARPAHADRPRPLQRLAARLLLLRGRSTARAPGWSSSAPTGWPTAEFVDAPVPAAAGPAPRHPRRPARRPAPRRATSSPGCRRRSPTTPGRCRRWTGCARRFPHTLVLAFEPADADRSAVAGRAHRTAAPTTTSPSTSSPTCAARPPPTPSPRCSGDACDACCDDRDLDTLVAGGA